MEQEKWHIPQFYQYQKGQGNQYRSHKSSQGRRFCVNKFDILGELSQIIKTNIEEMK